MKSTFASDAMTFPDTAVEEDCSQSLPSLEKRKHDESPQSPSLPTEKRIRCENDRNLLIKDHELEIFNKLSVDDQKSILEHRALFGGGFGFDGLCSEEDEEEIGELGGDHPYNDPDRDYPYIVCSNPFVPLDFKQDPKLYDDLKDFGLKEVAFFNRRYKYSVVFDEIESVTSCQATCQHHLVIVKVIDPSENKIKAIVLRGKAPNGFQEAKDFLMLSFTPA